MELFRLSLAELERLRPLLFVGGVLVAVVVVRDCEEVRETVAPLRAFAAGRSSGGGAVFSFWLLPNVDQPVAPLNGTAENKEELCLRVEPVSVGISSGLCNSLLSRIVSSTPVGVTFRLATRANAEGTRIPSSLVDPLETSGEEVDSSSSWFGWILRTPSNWLGGASVVCSVEA